MVLFQTKDDIFMHRKVFTGNQRNFCCLC